MRMFYTGVNNELTPLKQFFRGIDRVGVKRLLPLSWRVY